MANTVVSDPPTDDKDDALVIMVNADGTITVDQETLQRLIASQHPTNVSVVRVDGETPADDTGESHVNLTVEGYFNQQREEEPSPPLNDLNHAVDNAAPCDVDTDPFSQMDPEHLARLESALQSEQAKEILGTKLEDSNLSEMLEILEGKDDVRVRPPQQEEAEDVMTTLVEAHNDHSYTNEGLTPIYRKVPVSQVPASRPPQTVVKTEPIRKPLVHSPASLLRASSPASTPRPVVRANRSVRPTKITRPGSVQGPNVIVVRPPGVASTPGEEQQLQQKVVSIPKQPVIAKQSGQQIIQRTKLVNKAGEEIKTVRKVITKLPAPGLQRVGVTSEKRPLVIPAQKKSPVSQKVVVGKKRPSVEPGTAVVVESRPTTATPKGDSPLATVSTTASPLMALIKKKTAQVVLEKLSTTTSGSVVSAGASAPTLATPQPLAVASPGAHEKKLTKTRKPESLKLIQQEMTKYTTSAKTTVPGGQKTPTPAAALPAALKTPETPSTPGGESKKIKKEKPKVLGPELFSTPDVIRRVSTDKEKQQTPTNVVASQPQPSLGEPVTQVRQIDDAEAPRVQVQTLPTLIPVTKCDTISPESLLDSIHAEVVKGDPVLDESLLRELTCDDDAVAGLNAIEETLQKMEADSASVSTTLPPTSPQPQEPSQTVTTPATNERIRKLPPIELPTTRSASKKKAAAVTGDATEPTTTPSPVAGVVQTPPAATKMEKRPGQKASPVKERRPSEKTARKSDVRRASSSSEKKSKPDKKSGDDEDDDDDEEVESGDDSWNSEDDPDRLWCICQKPHNNRFMICCDVCADWFHGKCVGITKALGQQMEQQGVDWTCPKCKQAQMKKAAESSSPMNQRPSISKGPTQQQLVALECLVCKKPAKAASIFCSDVCVKKHAKMSLFMLKREVEGLNISTRVVVCEKKTGRMLTGDKAPTVELLADWLVKHPTFEVLNPNVLPPNKYYAKSTNKPQPVKSEKPALKQSVLQTRVNQSGVKTVGFGPKGAVKEKKPPTAGSTGQQAHAVKVKNEGEAQLLAKKLVTSQTSGASSPARKPKEDAAPGTPGSSTSTGSSTATSATTAPAPPKAKRPRKEPPAQSSDAGATTKTEGAEKENEQQAPSAKSMIEPVRANVRRTLQELLNKRVKADPEIEVPVADIKALVENIEAELFNHFQDTNAKYKAKYRSLVFNINDPKNLTLYRKIVDKAVSPAQLVRMSPDELASQELAQWREKEQKHQLEIIKKNELELIHQAKTVVLKSRKGEEVIQSKNHEANISELESALNRTAEDVQEELNGIEKKEAEVTPVPSIVAPPSPSSSSTSAPLDKEKKKDEPSRKRDRERRRNRDRRHRSRSRSKRSQSKDRSSSKSSSRRDSKKSRSPSKERPLKRKSRSHSRERVEKMKRSRSSEMKERKPERKPEKVSVKVVVIKKEPSEKKDQSADGDQRSLTPPPPSSGLSGSVAVKKEDDLSDREPSSTVTIATPPYSDEKQSVWTGTLNMTDVARIRCSMFEVSGSCDGLDKELSNWLDCIGRIPPESVWDYVSRMKKAGTKDIVVVRFHAEQEEERANYMSFYTYLHSRGRMAVVEHASTSVKDFYVLPLANHAPIPQVLLPLDGPGFDDFRPNLLLGIVIRSKRGKKRGQEVAESSRVKSSRSSKSERSYTPPLPGQRKRSKPPLPTVGSLDEPEDESLDPDLNEPYSPGDGDENEAYSPGDSDPPSAVPAETPKPAIASSTTTAAAASTPDIQKNLEEVNRMIEEKRQKLESMTSYPAIPGLGGSPPPYSAVLNIKVNDDDDENAAYSPPDSFTPPHPGIPTGVPAPASSSSSSSTAAPSIPSFLDTKALPDIKLPSNLQEILASIKVKPPQPASGESGSSAPSDIKGSDPIVQAYTTQPSSEVEDDASRDTVEMRTTRARSSAVAAAAAAAAASASATASRSRDPRQRPEPPTCVLPTAPTLPGSEPVGVGTTVSASGPPRVPPDYTTLAAAARGAPPPAVFFPPHIGPPPILSHAFQALPPQPPTVEPPRNNPAWVQPPSTVPRMFMPPPPPPQFRNFRMGAPGGSPGGFRGATPGGPPQHRLQNEWDKEIREFEARKVRHMDRDMRDRGDRDRDRDRDRNRDRRKRKSRSPPRRNSRSPRRRSSRRPSLPSN